LVGPTTPVTNSKFSVPIHYRKLNNDIILQFELFSFTTVSNGQILKGKLSKKLRPKNNEIFKCSTNDAFLTTFSISNILPFPTSDVAYFTVTIKKNGELTISSDTNSVIPAGSHTFNSQSIQYKINSSNCVKLSKSILSTTISVLDGNAYPLTGSNFNVNLTLKSNRCIIVVRIPSFPFTISADIDPNDPQYPNYELIPGGQLQTTAGYISPAPNQIQTVLSSDQQFNVSIDTYGALRVASPINIGGILNPGTYTLPATTITYLITPNKDLTPENLIIGPGFTNINNLNESLWNGSLRDLHTNDFYDNTFIFGWLDNSNIGPNDDPTSTMFFYVSTGTICNGKFKFNPTVNLASTLVNANNPGYLANFDTSVAINRTNPLNMVASQTILSVDNVLEGLIYISVTIDGGLNWSTPNLLLTTPGYYDARGLIADKFGNFYYVFNQVYINNPGLYIYISSNGGYSWNLPIFIPVPATIQFFDYPQLAVGNNGLGDYGLFIQVDQILLNYDLVSQIYFFPSTGLGQINSDYQLMTYPNPNQCSNGVITTKEDGTLFINSMVGFYFGVNYYVNSLFRKSPGALDPLLLTGPNTIINSALCLAPTNSYPVPGFSYYPISEYGNIYDNSRKLLYNFFQERPNVYSQDIYLFLVLSFDEGNTFSKRYPIASSHINNRGFSSAFLDTKSGAILVGFNDSRNSPGSYATQYFAAYLSKEKLDAIVKDAKSNKKYFKYNL
jgi:hypothetical protein